jgi:hypothetical protein
MRTGKAANRDSFARRGGAPSGETRLYRMLLGFDLMGHTNRFAPLLSGFTVLGLVAPSGTATNKER